MTSSLRNILGLQVLLGLLFLAQSGNGQANLGRDCFNTFSCSHANLKCENFVCVCWEPYVPSADHSWCSVPIGVRCASEDRCFDPNASCLRIIPPGSSWAINTCTCNAGFTQDPETDVCRPRIGTKCDIDGVECLAGDCVAGKCECANGQIPSPEGDACGVPILGSCTSQSDCANPNAECDPQSKTCQCKADYQQTFTPDGILNCNMRLGGACSNVSECATTSTICEELRHKSACTCQIGYVPSETRDSCLEVTNQWPGTCRENRQCSAMFGRYSSCQSGSCTCATGYAYLAEDNTCIPEHAAVAVGAFEGIKSLALTLLPYLPSEAKIAVEDALNALY